MAKEDRVKRFEQWVRRNKYLSAATIVAVTFAGLTNFFGNARTWVDWFKRPPSPVLVDLTYGLAEKGFSVRATVINDSAREVHLRCVGLHVFDNFLSQNFWLKPVKAPSEPLRVGSDAIYSGFVDDVLSDDPRVTDVWLSIVSNTGTIFQSVSLLEEFKQLLAAGRRAAGDRDSGATVVVPSTTVRLERAFRDRDLSTSTSCELHYENATDQ